jgi:zinc protease
MRRIIAAAALGLWVTSPAWAVAIEDVTSPGGVHAWLVEDHATKVIALDFAIRCGSACDPADKQGLSMFALSLLDEGAGPYDSGQYQGKLSDLSASVSFDAGQDYLTGSVRTLVSTRDEVFDLLRLGLNEPRFDQPAVDRIRAELNQAIDGEMEDADAVSDHLFASTEFPNHPYANWPTGSKESVALITTDDLRHFAKTRLGRDGLIVSVVGDITAPELKSLLDKVFGGLPAKSELPVVPATIIPEAKAETILAKRPDPQSQIRFGQPGIAVHDKDFYAAMVLNHVLGGGGFSARLEQEVREKRGLAYGITTALVNRPHADYLYGEVGTQNARVGETIEIVKQEWAKMRDHGPTAEEVADAKKFLNGSYTIGLNSSPAIAARLLGLQEEGLGVDYFERRPKLIGAVTVEDTQRIAKQLLDPSKLLFAIAGDPTGIKPDKVIDAAE